MHYNSIIFECIIYISLNLATPKYFFNLGKLHVRVIEDIQKFNKTLLKTLLLNTMEIKKL